MFAINYYMIFSTNYKVLNIEFFAFKFNRALFMATRKSSIANKKRIRRNNIFGIIGWAILIVLICSILAGIAFRLLHYIQYH